MKKSAYKSKAKVSSISAGASTTLKIKDNYFKVEVHEERTIEDDGETDMQKEWEFLFDELNGIVDEQVEGILQNFK